MGISSSENLVHILNQPAELNYLDVSLTSSKAKTAKNRLLTVSITWQGEETTETCERCCHVCWRTRQCPRAASQGHYSIINPQWLHRRHGVFPDWYLLSLTWDSAPSTLYEKPGKIISPCLPFYENGAKRSTQTFNLPSEIKHLHLLAQKINTCDLIWAFIFT